MSTCSSTIERRARLSRFAPHAALALVVLLAWSAQRARAGDASGTPPAPSPRARLLNVADRMAPCVVRVVWVPKGQPQRGDTALRLAGSRDLGCCGRPRPRGGTAPERGGPLVHRAAGRRGGAGGVGGRRAARGSGASAGGGHRRGLWPHVAARPPRTGACCFRTTASGRGRGPEGDLHRARGPRPRAGAGRHPCARPACAVAGEWTLESRSLGGGHEYASCRRRCALVRWGRVASWPFRSATRRPPPPRPVNDPVQGPHWACRPRSSAWRCPCWPHTVVSRGAAWAPTRA